VGVDLGRGDVHVSEPVPNVRDVPAGIKIVALFFLVASLAARFEFVRSMTCSPNAQRAADDNAQAASRRVRPAAGVQPGQGR
jgi:hypothetical protein